MRINCFIPFPDEDQVKETIKSLKESSLINRIYLLSDKKDSEKTGDCEIIRINSLFSTETIRLIAAKSDTEYTLIYTKQDRLQMGLFALERMVQIATDTNAGLVYADHYKIND